jgi:hypothetical protein
MAPLEIRTFPGAGGGMDLAAPVHMLPDSKARWIVDGLVDRPGIVRQRGKLKGTDIISDKKPYGMMATYNPAGALVLAVHASDDSTTNGVVFLDEDNAVQGTYSYSANYDTEKPSLWQASNLVKGPGTVFAWAVSMRLDVQARIRGMGIWRGGWKPDYSTGTITATQGSTSVSGGGTSWSANVSPGMFLFDDLGSGNYSFLGVVRSVESNTALTLEDGALFGSGIGSAYKLTSVRGLSPRIGVGRISAASGQAVVNGTGTKFRQLGTGSTWAMFRQRDMTFIGNVSSIASDTQLTLAANVSSGAETANDKYIAIKISDTFLVVNPTHSLGFLSASWNERQFYANFPATSVAQANAGSRLWYSDTEDPESLDFTKDGSNLEIPSTESANQPIFGLMGTKDGLLIFKESETYILQGTADPTTWTLKLLTNNGSFSPMSIVAYKGGAIWAGDRGIFQYLNGEVKNLTEDNLGDWWTKSFVNFNTDIDRMYAMIERDHYILHAENCVEMPTGTGWYKGNTELSPASLQFVLNLRTEALTLWTNIGVRGHVYIPSAGTLESTTRFVVERGSNQHTYICQALPLFLDPGTSSTSGGPDDFAVSSSDGAGPDFYMETARYDMDDPQLRKLWKQVQLHYFSNAGLLVDVVLNFDTIGTTLGSSFPSTGTMTNKRLKFLKRSQLMAFRAYTINPLNPGSVPEECDLGPWAIGFKRQRPGRT